MDWQAVPAFSSKEVKQHCPHAHNSWSLAFPNPREVWALPCETFFCVFITCVPLTLQLLAPGSCHAVELAQLFKILHCSRIEGLITAVAFPTEDDFCEWHLGPSMPSPCLQPHLQPPSPARPSTLRSPHCCSHTSLIPDYTL